MTVELTAAQFCAIAALAEREDGVMLHQLAETTRAQLVDVCATPRGTARGFRVAKDGELTPIGETLPRTLTGGQRAGAVMVEALLIVDFQNDFVPGEALPVPSGGEIVEPALREAGRIECF